MDLRTPLCLLLGLTGCASDDTGGTGDTSTTTSDDGDELATTLPVTATFGESSATSTGGTGSTTGMDSTGASDTDGATVGSDSTTDPTNGSTDGSTGGDPLVLEWCRLQFPDMVSVVENEAFGVFGRFYIPGLTDLTGANDPHPDVVAEVGYGIDGSDPSMGIGAPWTWVPAGPNAGYGPGAPNYEANNDEYNGDVSIPMAGIYDFAFRVSADGGATWAYCDLDDLLTGGYTPDQAGHAEVSPP